MNEIASVRRTAILLSPALILMFAVSPAGAAVPVSPGVIRGVVRDRQDNTPLANASVVVIGRDIGAPTDSAGRFVIGEVAPGTVNVRASLIGFAPETAAEILVSPGRTTDLEFRLEPVGVAAAGVTVRAGYYRPVAAQPTSQRSLRYEEIRRAPGAGEDVQRAMQALPGVVSANDQTNEIVVRGGSPSENMTLIDGIEVDNTNHFPDESTSGGPINAVNTEFVREVAFTTGAFSARYGDRLSSVLGIELRDGEREGFRGQAELSMAGVGLNVEGGIAGGRGSYLAAFRKSYLDLIKQSVGLTAVPHYWDAQFRGSFDLSPTSRATLYALYTDDEIVLESDEGDAYSRGAETVEAMSHTAVVGGRFKGIYAGGVAELILAQSLIHYDYQAFEMPARRQIYNNVSTEIVDQLHLHWTGRAAGSELGVGVSLKPVNFDFSIWAEPDTTIYDFNDDAIADTVVLSPEWFIEREAKTLKFAAYGQLSRKLEENLTLTAGLRLDGFSFPQRQEIAPRLGLKWEYSPGTTLSLGYGVHYQAHSLRFYLFDPAGGNRNLPHARADHYVVGISRLLDDATLASLEGYYKRYSRLPVFEEDLRHDDPTFRSWRYLAVGEKEAWGGELFAQRKMSTNWYGTASYSYGKSRFNNTEASYPANFDIRHVGTLVFGYRTSLIAYDAFNRFQRSWYGWWSNLLPLSGDEVTISTRYRYVSGRPYTPRIWTDAGPELPYHWDDSGAVNSARMPYYSRWDVRWDSKWYRGRRSVVVFTEVQNLLDRANVADFIYADDGEVEKVYQFRFFFVGGVRVNF